MSQNNNYWKKLTQANLVSGEQPEASSSITPWYVRVLLGFSGWLASLFLLLFMAFAFKSIFDSGSTMIVVGLMMIAGCYLILHNLRVSQKLEIEQQTPASERKNPDFLEQISLSISLAGQLLLTFGIFNITGSKDYMAWFWVACFQVPLALIMPNYLHRFFSSFIATIGICLFTNHFALLPITISLLMALATWIWLNEFKYPKHIKRMQAIGYGLILAIIELKRSSIFTGSSSWLGMSRSPMQNWNQPWLSELILGILMLVLVVHLLKQLNYKLTSKISVFSMLSVILISVLSVSAQGVSIGVIILILGFSASNKVLQGLGIFTMLSYISAFYYFQQVTLLTKSSTLLILGITLLVVRWLSIRFFEPEDNLKAAQDA